MDNPIMVPIRMPEALRDGLTDAADNLAITRSALIRALLQEGLDRLERGEVISQVTTTMLTLKLGDEDADG